MGHVSAEVVFEGKRCTVFGIQERATCYTGEIISGKPKSGAETQTI